GRGVTASSLLVRGINIYGDPQPWSSQKSAVFTVLSFLNCQKYPPSLSYLLLTLGPSLLLLGALHSLPPAPVSRPLAVIGTAPLFYYVAHLFAMRVTSAPLAYM